MLNAFFPEKGNLKDASVSQSLKWYNRHIQNVYSRSNILQDFLFSFLYGV